MRSFQIGDRVVVKRYHPFWDDQAGVVLSYTGGYWIIQFGSKERDIGGFNSKYLELEQSESDFEEDLV